MRFTILCVLTATASASMASDVARHRQQKVDGAQLRGRDRKLGNHKGPHPFKATDKREKHHAERAERRKKKEEAAAATADGAADSVIESVVTDTPAASNFMKGADKKKATRVKKVKTAKAKDLPSGEGAAIDDAEEGEGPSNFKQKKVKTKKIKTERTPKVKEEKVKPEKEAKTKTERMKPAAKKPKKAGRGKTKESEEAEPEAEAEPAVEAEGLEEDPALSPPATDMSMSMPETSSPTPAPTPAPSVDVLADSGTGSPTSDVLVDDTLPPCPASYSPGSTAYTAGSEVQMNGHIFTCLGEEFETYCGIETMDPTWDDAQKTLWQNSWEHVGPCEMDAAIPVPPAPESTTTVAPPATEGTAEAATTEAPATTTEAPATTTEAATTEAPATTTEAPATTTEAATTEAPATTTEAPATTTEAAADTTEAAADDSPTSYPTWMPTATPPPCPPAYDDSRTDYAAGEEVEVYEHAFACHAEYVPYCNVAVEDGSWTAEELADWNSAWVHVGACQLAA